VHRPGLAAVLALALAAQAPAQPAGRTTPGDPLDAARRALAAQDPERAIELLAPLLRRDPGNAPALVERSTAYAMLGDLEACKADLERAVRADPKLRQAWLNRSGIAIHEQRWDDALADLREAERLDPAAEDNALNQGAVELLRGELPAATAQFRRYLERAPGSADAWFLVASNYAHSGYAALAVQHLERAVALDERARVRARTDANFADLASHRGFQQLLATDAWQPPAGALTAERLFRTRYAGPDSPIVVAILNTLQLSGMSFDPRVELTPDWALFWSDFRIKLVRNPDDSTTLTLAAAPGLFTPSSWESRAASFFREIDTQLLRLELAAERASESPP
jgi:tetratricopeptide (TPR) repeat protein